MNIKDTNRHFEKLSSFYKQIIEDGQINKIELELLKSYTHNFYESLLANNSVTTQTAAPKEIERVQTPVASVAPTPKAPIAAVAPIAEQAPAEALVESSNDVAQKMNSSDLDQLFSLEKGTEISDKLSVTPIKDIKKAMSINERIFTIKELFGGSQENFDKTMTALNEFSSYDEAKNFLSANVVSDNKWLEPSKGKKVKTFLKLIYRKYV